MNARIVSRRGDGGRYSSVETDTVTGAEIRTLSRDEIEVALGGRAVIFPVEYGTGPSVSFWGPAPDRWQDGIPLSADDRRTLRQVLQAWSDWSGMKADFVESYWDATR